jgi:hypothetical protein
MWSLEREGTRVSRRKVRQKFARGGWAGLGWVGLGEDCGLMVKSLGTVLEVGWYRLCRWAICCLQDYCG